MFANWDRRGTAARGQTDRKGTAGVLELHGRAIRKLVELTMSAGIEVDSAPRLSGELRLRGRRGQTHARASSPEPTEWHRSRRQPETIVY